MQNLRLVLRQRLALRGYVAGVFRIAELMASVQRTAGTEYLAFDLFDARTGRPLFRSLPPAETTDLLRWQGELVLPGQRWRVVFHPGAAHTPARPVLAWWALGLGLLFTLLLSYHLYSQAVRARRLEEANRAIEHSRQLIEHAHREWMDAFDALSDPIFLHDSAGRVMRANRAYADCAGVDFAEIIGRYYWEVFPRGTGPARACVLASQEVCQMEEEVVADTGHV